MAEETVAVASERRPIKARQSKWATNWAMALARRGVRPNTISWGSVAFAIVAGIALAATRFTTPAWADTALFLLAIVGIQGRLICNLLDGMVAVEGGLRSKSGEIYNDFPDRLADPIILIAAGYAAAGRFGVELGWLAALLAVLTAYTRVLGRSTGTPPLFIGPMAKQHRMACLTAACLIAAVGAFFGWAGWVMTAALAVISLGCVVTIARRFRRIVNTLEAA